MLGKSCFFIGHREADERIYPQLLSEVKRHIAECGVTEFIVGHYGGFDRMAARAVVEAKKEFPEIRLIMLLPYYSSEINCKLPQGFDETYYPPNMEKVPKRAAIISANRHIVDNTDFLIAYVWHPASNARDILEYAEGRRKSGKLKITMINGK